MKSIGTVVFISLTGIEVVAKFAGRLSAVHHKLRTHCVVHIATSISYNAGT